MDFTPSDDQQAIIDLAAQIIGDHAGVERLRERERADDAHHDPVLWDALVTADLVSIALPESAGGGGYGITEAAFVAEVLGRHVAVVPYVDAVAAARLLAAADDPLAAEAATGSIVVAALREGAEAAETSAPATSASPGPGDTWTVTGEKRLVSGAVDARAFVVPARAGDELALFVVDAADVTDRVDSTTSAGQVLRTVRLDGAPARRLAVADPLGALVQIRRELRILRCAQFAGVAAGAVALAAEHCKQREQFGAPIGTFQAVGHRMADAWLDANLMQATTRQAAWRHDNGLPAVQAAASAALWACQGGPRVVEAAQHVHGGVGVDLDYPVHRYFRWAKDLELQLGGASASALDLGAAIAAEPLTIG